MKMRLTKKEIKILLRCLDYNLSFITDYGSVDDLQTFISLLHLKQKIEKEVNLNAKKIK